MKHQLAVLNVLRPKVFPPKLLLAPPSSLGEAPDEKVTADVSTSLTGGEGEETKTADEVEPRIDMAAETCA